MTGSSQQGRRFCHGIFQWRQLVSPCQIVQKPYIGLGHTFHLLSEGFEVELLGIFSESTIIVGCQIVESVLKQTSEGMGTALTDGIIHFAILIHQHVDRHTGQSDKGNARLLKIERISHGMVHLETTLKGTVVVHRHGKRIVFP